MHHDGKITVTAVGNKCHRNSTPEKTPEIDTAFNHVEPYPVVMPQK